MGRSQLKSFATKIVLGSLSLALGFSSASPGPSLTFDPLTHRVVSQYRAGELWYPASLTKLMTAYLTFSALKRGALRLDQPVSVSALAASQPPSKVGIAAGSKISLDQALQATLVYSANDMAVVLAEAVGGSLPGFVDLMNQTAAHLGMTATHFTTANGLHEPDQVTTARDMALLVSELLVQFPEYRHYFSQDQVRIGSRELRNRNALLRQMPEADGLKTGFTCNAGFNLAASASVGGRTLVTISFGAPNWQTRANWAQDQLHAAFQKPAELGSIENVRNNPPNQEPVDLTETVCLGKAPAKLTPWSKVSGWGITLARFVSSSDALDALTSRMFAAGTPAGIIRIPRSRGFLAAIWNLSAEKSMDLCAAVQKSWPDCEVLTPRDIKNWKEEAAAEYKELQARDQRKQKRTVNRVSSDKK